jgi:hypothetical protein
MFPLLQDLVENAFAAAGTARQWVAFWGPVTTVPIAVAPFVAVGSVLALAILTGIAVAALATLIVALLVLYLLLTEIFGVSVELNQA